MGPLEEKPAAELEIYDPATNSMPRSRRSPIWQRGWWREPPPELKPRTSSQAISAQSRCFAEEPLPISGWSSQGTPLSSRRAAIGCILDRLTLLASGHEPKLAELFARAKLKRAGCGSPIEGPVDWMTGANDPRLRGPL